MSISYKILKGLYGRLKKANDEVQRTSGALRISMKKHELNFEKENEIMLKVNRYLKNI